MTFEQEDAFLKKYAKKYVKITTLTNIVYGLVYGIDMSCDTESGDTEIDIEPVEKKYIIPINYSEIVLIEIVSKEDCIGKDEEPLNI